MSKHTPGPWFSQYDDNGFYEIGSESVTFTLAFTYGEGDTDEANARLIAAAPDLLEALQDVLLELESIGPMEKIDRARAAIAKATGENR